MKKLSLLIVLIITLFVIPVKVNASDICDSETYACAYCEYKVDDQYKIIYLIKSDGKQIPEPELVNRFNPNEGEWLYTNIKESLTFDDFKKEKDDVGVYLDCPNPIYVYLESEDDAYIYSKINSQKEGGIFKRKTANINDISTNKAGIFTPKSESNPGDGSSSETETPPTKTYECEYYIWTQSHDIDGDVRGNDMAQVYSDGSKILGISYSKTKYKTAGDFSQYDSFANQFTENSCPDLMALCTPKSIYEEECVLQLNNKFDFRNPKAPDNTSNKLANPNISDKVGYCVDYLGQASVSGTIANFLDKGFTIIKIVAILAAIVASMIDIAKTMTNTENKDELKPAINRSIKRVVITVVLILLPAIIDIVFGFAGYEDVLCGIK